MTPIFQKNQGQHVTQTIKHILPCMKAVSCWVHYSSLLITCSLHIHKYLYKHYIIYITGAVACVFRLLEMHSKYYLLIHLKTYTTRVSFVVVLLVVYHIQVSGIYRSSLTLISGVSSKNKAQRFISYSGCFQVHLCWEQQGSIISSWWK